MREDGEVPQQDPPPVAELLIGGRAFGPDEVAVMGIVNRTPDSFFDAGAYLDDDAALRRVEQCVAEGAAVVDIGGVRAGPGEEVDADEELRRVVPFIARAHQAFPDLLLSVDTWRAGVAEQALDAGACLVNDAWQGADDRLAGVVGRAGGGLVVSHAGHLPPRHDPHRVAYPDVVADVVSTLTALATRAEAAGVDRRSILLDAAPDFGKNSYHSLAVVAATRRLASLGYPVLLAVSNKKFLAEAVGWDGAKSGRHSATLAATAVAVWEGARVVRAHDVGATRHVVDTVRALRTGRPRLARRALT